MIEINWSELANSYSSLEEEWRKQSNSETERKWNEIFLNWTKTY